jgi:hypothetical protein
LACFPPPGPIAGSMTFKLAEEGFAFTHDVSGRNSAQPVKYV